MTCFTPLRGFRKSSKKGNEIKFNIPFNEQSKYLSIDLPCGQCIGCRIDKSREWAIRCLHESSLYEQNCFITLTIEDEQLGKTGTLEKKHFQNFMKELRRKYIGKTRNNGKNMPEKINTIRYFHCGEYGTACRNCGYNPEECYCGDYIEGLGRPHHHALLFNFDFPDKVLEATKEGVHHYSSEILSKLWRKGLHDIGEITFESAAYVARYTIKKITGNRKEEFYKRFDNRSNRLYDVEPEYITMSRKPGIGKKWFEKYKNSDVYSKDFITSQGRIIKVPKYYDKLLEEVDPNLYEKVKRERRRTEGQKDWQEKTLRRLHTKELVKRHKISKYRRSI